MIGTDIYLYFNGQTEQAFEFYKTVFGGEFIATQRYRDMPGSDGMGEGDLGKIMHIALRISSGTTLMASDLPSAQEMNFRPGNNFQICLQAESEKEADQLFGLLSGGGRIEMPMNRTFWGAYFGVLEDKFGIHWMVSFSQAK
jgi:PhnB protein